MSVTKRICNRYLQEALDSILPCEEHPLNIPLLVAPRANDPRLIGSAFDYAMRFELQRHFLFAHGDRWIAKDAGRVLSQMERGRAYDLSAEVREAIRSLNKSALRWLNDAQAFARAYALCARPTQEHHRKLARHALRLAQLDRLAHFGTQADPSIAYLQGYLCDPVEAPESQAAQNEIAALIAIIPMSEFERSSPLLLNVHFGKASRLVGGARADLIAGSALLDIKVAERAFITREMMRQVLAYWMIARKARELGEDIPEIDTLGIYLARHGRIWTLKTKAMLEHPNYAEAERMLFLGPGDMRFTSAN